MTRADRLEIVRRHRYHWWRYVATNGHILADSGQGYRRRIDALNGARRVLGVDLAPQPDYEAHTDGQARQVWRVVR